MDLSGIEDQDPAQLARVAAAAVTGLASVLEMNVTGEVPRKPQQEYIDRAFTMVKMIDQAWADVGF